MKQHLAFATQLGLSPLLAAWAVSAAAQVTPVASPPPAQLAQASLVRASTAAADQPKTAVASDREPSKAQPVMAGASRRDVVIERTVPLRTGLF